VQPSQLSSWCKQENFFLFTPPMKMGQCVPKRRHIKFRRRKIAQRKEYNIHNTAGEWKTNKCINHSMYWYSIFSYMFRHFKMPSSGSQTWSCWGRFVGNREGWQLYIVTGGVLVGSGRDNIRRLLQYTAAILLCFPRTYLSTIMFDSLMMAF
jgi:hypothetical protein